MRTIPFSVVGHPRGLHTSPIRPADHRIEQIERLLVVCRILRCIQSFMVTFLGLRRIVIAKVSLADRAVIVHY